jgi:type IV pilus assembly protein PilB
MTDLASVLVQEGFITTEQLQDAKNKQFGAKKPLQELLVEMGFISEEALHKVVSRVSNMPLMDPEEPTDHSLLNLISFETARCYGVFPLRKEEGKLLLAMSNPADIMAIDDVKASAGIPVKPILATKSQIVKLIEENYHLSDMLYDLLKNSVIDTKISLIKEEAGGTHILDIGLLKGESSSAVKLVNLMLGDAVKMRSTDIHIEPQEHFVSVRYRIDGELKSIMKVPSDLHPRLVARIKILAGLDIAETRMAQDGRVKILVNDRRVDLRISIIPTFYGEKIAIRLLDQQEAKTILDKIGLEKEELGRFCQALGKPQGMILVTGPTGSGKTSTLYAALNFIKSETKNIITVEDPIEYLIEGVNQMQLNPAKEVTFVNSLRNILRQDPNVIFIGEIRDRETADIAFRASQTGHLVLSTLHTNNAVTSITRLVDLGLEPYLIVSSLSMVVAQRLVRLICPHCKEEYIPDPALLREFGQLLEQSGIKKFYRGKGCQQCDFSGFLGRTAVFEIMEVNEAIRTLVTARGSEHQIFQAAQNNGLRTLAESGLKKIAQGLTTLEEILRLVDISRQEQMVKIPAVSGGATKLLIVDDEEDILLTLAKRLETAGYAVVKARNGKEAIEMVFKESPDLIIMDVNMPSMDGFEATRILRSKLATASIPIVLLTAKQDKESELSGLDAGADDYITKPYDKDKLLARIKMLLRRK